MSDLHLNFPALLEKALDWASDLEAQVLESGEELAPDLAFDARLAGVKEPARIRLLVAEEMPMPADAALRKANDNVSLLSRDGTGLTVGYAVIVRAGHERERRLLVHEFVHVGQCERMGGMDRFLREYLTEVMRDGYTNAPLEVEADQRASSIASRERRPIT